MTVSLDATFGNLVDQNSWQSNSTFSGGFSNKTAAGSTLVVACIFYESTTAQGQQSVSSLTVSGLTFTKRGRVQNNLNAADHASAELWTAPASSQFNAAGSTLTWTLTFSGTVDNAQICVFAITGLFNLSSPFDSGSLPQTAANATSTTPPVVTFSTTQAHDMLLFLSLQAAGGSTQQPVTPSGWTKLQGLSSSTGANFLESAVFYKSVSAAQSGATVQDANTNNDYWTAYVDAFTSDNNNQNVSATVSLALTKASFFVAATSTEEGGTTSMALQGVAFAAAGSERVTGAGTFALTKASISALGSVLLGATSIVGSAVLRGVRGIRDTILSSHVVGRMPGAHGAAQQVPVTVLADQIGAILAGGLTLSPTTKGAQALSGAFLPLKGGVMAGAINLPNGSVAAPSLAFNTNYGFYYDISHAAIGFDVAGAEVAYMSASQFTFSPLVAGGIAFNLIGQGSSCGYSAQLYMNGGQGPVFNWYKGRGTIASPLSANQNDTMGSLNFRAIVSNTNQFGTCGSVICTLIDAAPSPTSTQGRLSLSVTPSGSINPTEVMRLEAATGLSMFGANVVVDANRNIRGAAQAPAKTRVIPTTGFSNTIGNGIGTYYMKPAGTLATGTLTMPPAPIDGQEITIATTQTITAFTLSPNAGQSINNAPTTLAASTSVAFFYDATDAAWVRCY